MPSKGMKGQRPIGKAHTFGRKIGNEASHKSVGGGKRIERLFEFSVFQPRNDQAEIHGNTAKLKGKSVERIFALAEVKGIEKLFVKLRERKKNSDSQ